MTKILDLSNIVSDISDLSNNIDGLTEKLKGLSLEDAKLVMNLAEVDAYTQSCTLSNLGYSASAINAANGVMADKVATDADTVSKYENLKVTNMLKVAWGKLSAFALANPWIVAAVAGVAAIGLTVGAVDLFTESLDEAQDKAEKSKQSYDELASELSTLEQEFKTSSDRIKELQQLSNNGTITLVEQNELDKLKETNEELEREIRLKEHFAEKSAKQASDDAVNAITNLSETHIDYSTGDTFKQDRIDAFQSKITEATELQNKLNDAIEKQKQIETGYGNEADKYSNDNEWKNLQNQIDVYKSDIEVAESAMEKYYNELSEEDDALRDRNNNIIEGAEETVSRLETVYNGFDLYNSGAQTDTDKLTDKLVDLFGQDAVAKLTQEELEIAYTISYEEANKALEQEKNKIKSELESLSEEGNVDLTIRPVIDSSAMQSAGWNVEDGSIVTTFTQGEFIWQGDEENGQYVYVHYTPILPDGTVLTPDELTDYLYGTLEGSQSVLDADNKGIVLKVDTDLNIPEGDIKKFTNGEGSTDAIDGLIQKTGEWDDKVHGVQEQYYGTGEGVNYASTALDGLIEKHKELENPDEDTALSYDQLEEKIDSISSSAKSARDSISDLNDAFAEQKENGSISIDTMMSLVEAGYATALQFDSATGACTINTQAMYELVKSKIENQIADLQILKTDIANKLHEDGVVASNSALGFLSLASAKLADVEATKLQQQESIKEFNNAEAQIIALQNALKNYDKISIGNYSTSFKGVSDSVKDAMQEAKDHIESYMNFQKISLEKGTIDYNTYCNTVSNLLKKMFKDGKISAQDYHTYTKEMLETQKEIYDKALSAITNLFDKEIEKQEDIIENIEKQNELLEKQMTQMENAADAVVDYYDSLIDAENDTIKGIEDQIDGYDALISVSDRLYESEQQALEAQKDAIQDKIDLLNDENSALDLQLRKEQALDELYKARNQRTKYIYAGEGKGFIYKTDTDAIREAQQKVKDIETELIISQLEKEQEALDESIDALQKYRDAINDIADAHKRFEEESIVSNLLGSDYANIILGTNLSDWDKLKDVYISSNEEIKNHEDTIARIEEAKEQWSDLSNVIDDQIKEQAASQQFGSDWQKQIQEGNLISFEEYKELYLGIQSQINDNNSTIESIEEKIAYYETLKENYSSVTTLYEEEEEKRYATMLLGQEWEKSVLDGRLETLNAFKDEYIAIQNAMRDAEFKAAQAEYESNNVVNGAGDGTGDNGGGNPDPPEADNPDRYRVVDQSGSVVKDGFSDEVEASKYIEDAPKNNKRNRNLRIEKYHTGLEKGVVGKNLSASDEILLKMLRKGSGILEQDEVPVILRKDEVVLNYPQWTNLAETLASKPIDYSHMFKNLNTSLPQNVVQKRDMNIKQEFNITCPGVTSQQVIKELERQLQPMGLKMYQDLHKR